MGECNKPLGVVKVDEEVEEDADDDVGESLVGVLKKSNIFF